MRWLAARGDLGDDVDFVGVDYNAALVAEATRVAALEDLRARFLVANVYAERISGLAVACLLQEALGGRGGRIDWGELALAESGGDRAVGLSFFARWSREAA